MQYVVTAGGPLYLVGSQWGNVCHIVWLFGLIYTLWDGAAYSLCGYVV